MLVKMLKNMGIAAIFTLTGLVFMPHAISAERFAAGELTVLPYTVSVERYNFKGQSSRQYAATREHITRQEVAALASFAVIDYAQSVAMFYGSNRYQELNPLFGSKPSRSSMALFGIIGVGLCYLVAETLSDPWKQIFMDSVIASERLNIEDNRRVYQGWNTDGPPVRGRSFYGIPFIISFRLE